MTSRSDDNLNKTNISNKKDDYEREKNEEINIINIIKDNNSYINKK